MKEKLTEAQIKQLMAQAVQTGVQVAFSAMQGGAQVAMQPQIAPIADAIMQGAGYQKPNPVGDDPNFPTPVGGGPMQPAPADQGADLGDVQANTSPAFPPVPQQAEQGMTGIETLTTADNIEGVA